MDKQNALNALSALSQDTRLEVFRLLVRNSPESLAAGDIATQLGVVQNTMSAHLAILSRAGLTTSERSGRVVKYSANFAEMRALLTFLLQDCCQGAAEICDPLFALTACKLPKENQ